MIDALMIDAHAHDGEERTMAKRLTQMVACAG